MARRGGGPTITLFSFQDIITSVSGIMIFVTLLLALELADKTQGNGANPALKDAADLKARIIAARSELDALRLRTLAEVPGGSSLTEERASREAVDQVELAERELTELERRAVVAGEREADAKTRAAGSETDRQELLRAQAEVNALRLELAEARESDRLYFEIEADPLASRDGWFVLLDGRAVTVAPLGRPGKPREFRGAPSAIGGLDVGTSAFLEWAAHEASRAYLLIVSRPSGLDRMSHIEQALALDVHPYGIDLVNETQQVLDPDRGVFRP